MSNANGFFLSFTDGRCRLARGHALSDAVADAVLAATATQCACKVLDRSLTVVGHAAYETSANSFTFRTEPVPVAAA